MKNIVVDLPPEQGHALAQFVKRTGFDDCQRLAIAMTAVSKPRRCGRRSRSCNPPSRTAAPTRDDDIKADPLTGAGLFLKSAQCDMHPNRCTTYTPVRATKAAEYQAHVRRG
jgi:hypothetical protein